MTTTPDIIEVLVPDGPAVIEVVTVAGPEFIEVLTGPQGPSPDRSLYAAATLAIVAGVLTVDMADGTSFLVPMDQNVSAVILTGIPPSGRSQGVELYFEQDGIGGRAIDPNAWPAGTEWPDRTEGALSGVPGGLDIIVIKAAFGRVLATLVGSDYGPPA